MKSRKYWSTDEFERFKKAYESDGHSPSELSVMFNRDIISIRNKINRSGLHHTYEQTQKIKSKRVSGVNNPMYGKPAWSRGQTKQINSTLETASVKISKTRKHLFQQGLLPDFTGSNNPMYGRPAWNNGLNKETDNRIAKYSQTLKKSATERWNNASEKEKELKRKHCAFIGANCKKRKTSIELKVEIFLKELQLEYISGYQKDTWVFDFYLPKYNLVIECQGDYWHGNPSKYNSLNLNHIQKRNIDRDIRKIKYLKSCGIFYLFIWEYDIKLKFEHVKDVIRQQLNT